MNNVMGAGDCREMILGRQASRCVSECQEEGKDRNSGLGEGRDIYVIRFGLGEADI